MHVFVSKYAPTACKQGVNVCAYASPVCVCVAAVLQAVALHLLSGLLSADKSSTVLAELLHRDKVPRALLDCVVGHAEAVIMSHAHKAQVRGGGCVVVGGGLGLLTMRV